MALTLAPAGAAAISPWREGVNRREPWDCGLVELRSPGRQRREGFFQSDWRSKSVEQLSQLFTARHASGSERKHLGQMFYNKCFTALPGRGDSDLKLKHPSKLAAAPAGA